MPNCKLCDTEIKKYNPIFYDFKIDSNNIAHICFDCTDKFRKWQQEIMIKLFPTKTAKKFSKN